MLIILADTYAHLNHERLARRYLEDALVSDPDRAETMFRAAELYEMLADRELALKWIGEALRNGLAREELEHSAALEALRSDPRFQEVLQ